MKKTYVVVGGGLAGARSVEELRDLDGEARIVLVGGERSLVEEELHHLSGYDYSRPVRIGNGAIIGAGSVVTRDIPANSVAVGNPARIVGYVDTVDQASATAPLSPQVPAAQGGVQLFRMPLIKDMRAT